jgi:uncharacterized protein Yka (UPF0111/DUF47 family)
MEVCCDETETVKKKIEEKFKKTFSKYNFKNDIYNYKKLLDDILFVHLFLYKHFIIYLQE